MKTELKAKFLQHLLGKKKDDQGFTLIELLVVIIIIGILSAIALPSFLNQAKKAKQSEAKTYVGSLNRGQQAYMTENDKFSSVISDLGVGISETTANYSYATAATNDTTTATNTRALSKSTLVASTSGLKNYAGLVFLATVGGNNELTSKGFLCESAKVNEGTTSAIDTAGKTECDGTTWKQIK
ncbi:MULTISPECIES: type IV pilin-like G/H family protein [Nostocales]|uniref:Prepilin-type N-terminal cleavage/methylation domain-containing protein n=1 Tax=Dolichospermum flos-aquae UHCC 0037 TaxID=2590026 RepID=A0ACC7S0C7_DOLFA|nr:MULTISPECIES: type IV pilin-like G/H family protein [Nostocales]MBO1064035.1 prepilin-type N-terminal cleavage/methylation domain-containing protein [Anabaena sp. 54]MTJ41903.1 prepilin-type N-terminal cleavage/methylation domain-containing protein [Dolichospermum flos-aquae UHCC 0037]